MATALCRHFRRKGWRVAPFKAWNMALNSSVTPDGLEIGRAQAVQAEAWGVTPEPDRNPVLVKGEPRGKVQVVVLGKAVKSMTAVEYARYCAKLRPVISESLERLKEKYDLVLLEGAGSPAEINLKGRDLANMVPAAMAEAPVLLVGDIDRGGVFASLLGTLELLSPGDRARVKAFLINKFRGNPGVLKSGMSLLEKRTGIPFLGVLPYLSDLNIAEEDSAALGERETSVPPPPAKLTIAILRFPHLSNFDDYQPLEKTEGVRVSYVQCPQDAAGSDLVILPGTKATVEDLKWLRRQGFDRLIAERAREKKPVLGICGGYQMLGKRIEDPGRFESGQPLAEGLGLLPISTCFEKEKVTAQVEAVTRGKSLLAGGGDRGKIAAYEIHMGRVRLQPGVEPLFHITSRNQRSVTEGEGAVDQGKAVVGTLLHGLFENDSVRSALFSYLGRKKGIRITAKAFSKDAEYDRLADWVGENLNMKRLERMVGKKKTDISEICK